MRTLNKIKEFTIDPAVWLRGDRNSFMLTFRDGRRKQCCVGIYATACGATDAEIHRARYLSSSAVPPVRGLSDGPHGHPKRDWVHSTLSDLYQANDSDRLTERQRRSFIRAGFRKLGITVHFKREPKVAGAPTNG